MACQFHFKATPKLTAVERNFPWLLNPERKFAAMADVRTVGKSVLKAVLPAPLYGGLNTLRREAFKPKSGLHRRIGRIASERLSPTQYLKLRSVYLKAAGSLNLRSWISRNRKPPRIDIQSIIAGGEEFASVDDLVSQHGKVECATVICCAFLGRHDVLDIVIEEATQGAQIDRTVCCLVGSDDSDRDHLLSLTRDNPNVIGAITANRPVGLKWQTSVHVARETCDFEILAITGSDDVLPGKLIDAIVTRHRENVANTTWSPMLPALYATIEWVLLAIGEKQSPVPQIVRCNYKLEDCLMPLGAGRFYARSFVDEIDGLLFDVRRNNLLDDLGFETVTSMGKGVEYFDIDQGCVCSIKGDWSQLNNWDAIVDAPTIDATEFSFQGYACLRHQLSDPVFQKLFPGQSSAENPA